MGVDTLISRAILTFASLGEEDLTGHSASGAVTLVRSADVVEIGVVIGRGLHGRDAGEEASPEPGPPELAEDCALEPLDKAVGLGVPRFGACVANATLGAGPVEGSPILVALIGQDALERPAGSQKSRQDSVRQEAGGGHGRELQTHVSHGERASHVAGGVLPNLPYSLQHANVERNHADQFPSLGSPGYAPPGGTGRRPAGAASVRSAILPPEALCASSTARRSHRVCSPIRRSSR